MTQTQWWTSRNALWLGSNLSTSTYIFWILCLRRDIDRGVIGVDGRNKEGEDQIRVKQSSGNEQRGKNVPGDVLALPSRSAEVNLKYLGLRVSTRKATMQDEDDKNDDEDEKKR